MIRKFCVAGAVLWLAACAVGPDYKRPALDMPAGFRGAPAAAQGAAFADLQWWAVLEDPVLQGLIKDALADNYNLRIAANHVLQAREQLGIARASQVPALSGFVEAQRQRAPPVLSDQTIYSGGLQLSWVLDFWGQYRRATEAARAMLLATGYAQNAVRITLIANVASAYFQLRAFDQELDASTRILQTNRETLRITALSVNGGASPITDQLQATLLVQQAQAQITQLEQSIAQTENQLSLLLGKNPGDIPRGMSLVAQPRLPEVPAGLPSQLLERRPDVREAELSLAAANANVGVAKAAFFPQIPLTASYGAASASLGDFLKQSANVWSVAGDVVQPIFEGGKIRSAYRLAWAQRDAAELIYRQSVQQAFADVANSLVGYQKSHALRLTLEDQTATYAETARLANDRYRGGSTGFLEVLTTQQQYFTSQLQSSQAWFAELQNYVQLYQALGGGWQH
ncbi:MAG TPA: efflux transporter outer membrane subunit [Steroidobacteraceae bacterium]|jgi:multidrug efflux system outer membrane protein|nr:efflux transporter outer membrane subunit [Steroidobacteraceae bacterium]